MKKGCLLPFAVDEKEANDVSEFTKKNPDLKPGFYKVIFFPVFYLRVTSLVTVL